MTAFKPQCRHWAAAGFPASLAALLLGFFMSLGALAAEPDAAQVTAVEDAAHAGDILAHSAGEPLNFEKLKALSPDAAAVLAEHKADILINSLEKLDADIAAALANFEHTLSLHGITEVDDETAAALAKSRATLSLENIESLTHVGLAEKLAAQPFLVFRRLKAVEKPVADALAAGGCSLALPMLEKLEHGPLATKLVGQTVAIANQNDQRHPSYVFEKLTDLSPEAAAGLCLARCNLYFKALLHMPPKVAAAFEGHRGVLDVDRLQQVAPAAAASLLKNDGPLDLGGCAGFVVAGQPVQQAVLAALIAHQAPLSLGDLQDVPKDLADAIRQRKHHTKLLDVACLTTTLALGLANQGGVQGVVWLPHTEAVEPPNAEQPGAVPNLLKMPVPRAPPGPLGAPAVILSPGLRSRIPAGHAEAIERHLAIQFGNQFGP
jgi:hypothetical protein